MPRSNSQSKSRPSDTVSQAPTVFRNPYSSVANTSNLTIQQPTLGQSIKQGFGFGAGSAIAHRIFGLTPSITAPSDKKVELPCEKELQAFQTCLKSKSTDDFCGQEQISYTQCINLSN